MLKANGKYYYNTRDVWLLLKHDEQARKYFYKRLKKLYKEKSETLTKYLDLYEQVE